MSRHDGYWETNPGEVERARIMWEQGLSTAHMGRLLGVSKNAVCGLKSRKAWPQRGSPIKYGSDGPPRSERSRQRREQPLRVGLESLPPLLALLDDPIRLTAPPRERPAPKPKPVVEVPPVVRQSKHRCRWLDGDNPFIRCCGMAQFGKSYCLAHHKIAYRKLHDLRDEAA